MKPLSQKYKNDIRLAVGLFTLAVIALVLLFCFREDGGYVSVVQDGVEIAQYPLSKEQTVVIPDENGDSNTLVIKDHTANITDATCPDKLCVKQSAVSYNGETIVCLPHKLVIKVVSDTQAEVDITA